VFKARIEMRQVGVRNEAKMIGGLGKPAAGNSAAVPFLQEFAARLRGKMAKSQNLALNPPEDIGPAAACMCLPGLLNWTPMRNEAKTGPRWENAL